LKINLGSGGKPLSGFINADKNPEAHNINVVCDLDNYPWPFTSGSIQLIVMDQCLEHLVDHNMAMREIHRILSKGGCANISVPHFTWQFAFHDPTHRHFFGYNTFFYYTGNGGYFDFKFSSCKVKLTFGKRLSIWNYLLEPIFNRFPYAYEQSPLRIFPALNVKAELIK
jgi:ubiquinone/menaquinone biosynthesis C-methylase UbiE